MVKYLVSEGKYPKNIPLTLRKCVKNNILGNYLSKNFANLKKECIFVLQTI